MTNKTFFNFKLETKHFEFGFDTFDTLEYISHLRLNITMNDFQLCIFTVIN
jgi:hypothetical protein